MPPLHSSCLSVLETCTSCGLCAQHCEFLKQYGLPHDIASGVAGRDASFPLEMAFHCSLCNLCSEICPCGSTPPLLFHAMRQTCASLPQARDVLRPHGQLLAYEARGLSERFGLFAVPDKARSIFFPGCALPGSNPWAVIGAFDHLRGLDPDLGVVLGCCAKPSQDLGRTDFARDVRTRLFTRLEKRGVRRIITACPNCHRVFTESGAGLEVVHIFELLAPSADGLATSPHRDMILHDPCATRFEEGLHAAVRSLAAHAGISLAEFQESGTRTICCGEGGSVGRVRPDLASSWTERRINQTGGLPILSYCAGCVGFLGRHVPAFHLLDLLFPAPRKRLPLPAPLRSLANYHHRLRVKRTLARSFPCPV